MPPAGRHRQAQDLSSGDLLLGHPREVAGGRAQGRAQRKILAGVCVFVVVVVVVVPYINSNVSLEFSPIQLFPSVLSRYYFGGYAAGEVRGGDGAKHS